MKAINISGQAPGGNRTRLADVLPLATPFVVQIFPIYACNFTCEYCFHAVPKKERGFVSDWPIMKFDLYKKCIDELALFGDQLKVLRFVGMGEPLLHKNIAEMVAYAVAKKVALRVELLTNGSLLTRQMSDALIGAGLSRLVVSLQGISKEKYRQISKVDIDFENFVANIEYFYKHKTNTHVYIKIVDYALDGNGYGTEILWDFRRYMRLNRCRKRRTDHARGRLRKSVEKCQWRCNPIWFAGRAYSGLSATLFYDADQSRWESGALLPDFLSGDHGRC